MFLMQTFLDYKIDSSLLSWPTLSENYWLNISPKQSCRWLCRTWYVASVSATFPESMHLRDIHQMQWRSRDSYPIVVIYHIWYALHPATANQFKLFEGQPSSRTVSQRRCLDRDGSLYIGCWALWLETRGFSLDENLGHLNGTDAIFDLALPREIMSYTYSINTTNFTNYHIRISL